MRACALAVLVVAGLAGVAGSAGASPATSVVGGSPAERALVREIVAGLGSSHLPELRIVSTAGGVKLRTSAVAPRPAWEALVVGGSYLERSGALRLRSLREVDVGPIGWPASNVSGGGPPRATAAGAAAARSAMLRAAAASGARVAELTVARPSALAVAVRLTVGNAARFMQHRLRAFVLKAPAHALRYEGLYLELDDTHGPAWVSAESRLGGVTHVRPSLRGCNPLAPPGLPTRAPRCPA